MMGTQTVIIGIPDKRVSQELCRHLGGQPDAAVVTADQFDEVLLAVLDGHADLVVLDLDLPGAGGGRAVEVLRHAGPSVVLLVLVPDDDLPSGRQVLRHNVFYHGIKPVSDGELRDAVTQALAYNTERRARLG